MPSVPDHSKPRLFYGWVMLPVAMIAFVATAPGQTIGVAVFNASIRASLELTHTQIANAYMFGTLLAAIPMSYVGLLMDRYGLRRTMTVTIVLFGLGCLLTSQATGVFSLFLGFLMLRMFGQGALSLLSANTLAFWFDRRLGTVEGIRHVGFSAAIAGFPMVALAMIGWFGWRWTYALMGLAVWAVMLPLMLLFRNRPADVGQCKDGLRGPAVSVIVLDEPGMTLRQAAGTRAFWIVAVTLGAWSLINTGIIFHMVPLLGARSLDETQVARLFAVFAGTVAVMHVVGGVLADRFALHRLMTVASVTFCASIGLIWATATPAMIIASGAMLGLSQGLLIAATGPLWPRYYGRRHLGQIRGSLTTVMVAASALGPILMSLCADRLGSFDPMLVAFLIASLPLALLAPLATKPTMPSEAEPSSALDEPVVADPIAEA